MIKNDKKPVFSALMGVTAIYGILMGFALMICFPNLSTNEWLLVVFFAIFLALAIIARWAPIPAAVAASLLFGSLLAYQAYISTELLMKSLYVKVPIIVLLLVALLRAFKPGKQQAQDYSPETTPSTNAAKSESETA